LQQLENFDEAENCSIGKANGLAEAPLKKVKASRFMWLRDGLCSNQRMRFIAPPQLPNSSVFRNGKDSDARITHRLIFSSDASKIHDQFHQTGSVFFSTERGKVRAGKPK